jgi:hypothetical protein
MMTFDPTSYARAASIATARGCSLTHCHPHFPAGERPFREVIRVYLLSPWGTQWAEIWTADGRISYSPAPVPGAQPLAEAVVAALTLIEL